MWIRSIKDAALYRLIQRICLNEFLNEWMDSENTDMYAEQLNFMIVYQMQKERKSGDQVSTASFLLCEISK